MSAVVNNGVPCIARADRTAPNLFMIQPTSTILGYNRADAVAATKTAPATPPPTENVDNLSRANSQALQTALANSPEVRPDVVEHGKRLLVDLNYPPRAIIESLSKLFLQSADLTEKA